MKATAHKPANRRSRIRRMLLPALAPALAVMIFYLITCTENTTVLQEIRSRGELRVVTRNAATSYYEGPLGPGGLEYELTSRFAERLGVRLNILVPDNFTEILAMVVRGDADLAAAGLTITEERRKWVRFGPAYQKIAPQLVYRVGTRTPKNLGDLNGTLEVVAGSSHEEKLRELKAEYPDLSWVSNDELSSEELLALVWEQVIDYTIADSNEVAIVRRFYPELRVAFDISGKEPLAWAFPLAGDASLYEEAQKFFGELRDSGELEQLLERYYGHVQDFDYVGTRRYMAHIEQRLPQYLELFQRAAAETGVDWRLLAAIGYQESHWNPKAVSPTGVRGLMMLTLDTMRYLGLSDRRDPEQSIMGGARYFAIIRNGLPEQIREPDRTWMALAAYNVGIGHLQDARKLAEKIGGNPNRWADVKKALPLLSQEKWYKQTRYGYARGREPVRYVENIRSYYDILVWYTEKDQPEEPPPPPVPDMLPVL